MEFLSLDDRIPVQAISQWLWVDSRNFAHDAELTTLAVNLRIEEFLSSNQESTFGQILGFWFVSRIKRCMQHGEKAAFRLIQSLQNITSQNNQFALLSLSFLE